MILSVTLLKISAHAKPTLSFFLEQKSDEPNPLVEQLLTLMEKLTPQQIDLIYDLFGSQRQLTEIAKEEGKSVTAIHNRKSKIIARLRKLFAEQGIL
jgi:DNA-directed RNA polymerase specialized sigma24 family protein